MNTHTAPYLLYQTDTEILIRSTDNSPKQDALLIDRNSGIIRSTKDVISLAGSQPDGITGVVGMVELLSGPALVVATRREHAGDLFGHAIYRIKETKDERRYATLYQKLFATGTFYYSVPTDRPGAAKGWNLTQSTQRWNEMDEKSMTTDSRFFWNEHMCGEEDSPLRAWAHPMIRGNVDIFEMPVGARDALTLALISRLSKHRSGTRFLRRGVDAAGHVANFVETEQLAITRGSVYSYVQTRGSVPVYWTQTADLKYSPKILFPRSFDESTRAMRAHFDEQIRLYGTQICVNLLDWNPKKSEGQLEKQYSQHVEALDDARVIYAPFDFHTQCKGLRYDRLSRLLTQIDAHLSDFGYFHMKDGRAVSRQTGVIRTNCKDCLDRTNVCQSIIARVILERQLQASGLLTRDTQLDTLPALNQRYKILWGDNGDTCSLMYTGTQALKRDYTRTGKRTWRGLAQDGTNSLHRYVLNNFFDGSTQDANDLVSGAYHVSASKPSPFPKESPWLFFALVVLLASFTLRVVLFRLPGFNAAAPWVLRLPLRLLYWGAVVTLAVRHLKANHRRYATAPALSAIERGASVPRTEIPVESADRTHKKPRKASRSSSSLIAEAHLQ